jgi:hypothetical protein
MALPPDLLAAYLATRYHLRRDPGVDFFIGRRSEELAQLLASANATTAAFLSAWNPASRPTDRAENDARNRQLLDDIAALGLEAIAGEGIGPTGWREESFFVAGLGLEQARALARRYRQNAIVFVERDGSARLEITAQGSSA